MSSSALQAGPASRARQGGKEGLSRTGLRSEQPSATSCSTPRRARGSHRPDDSRSTAVKRNKVGELQLQHKHAHSNASAHADARADFETNTMRHNNTHCHPLTTSALTLSTEHTAYTFKRGHKHLSNKPQATHPPTTTNTPCIAQQRPKISSNHLAAQITPKTHTQPCLHTPPTPHQPPTRPCRPHRLPHHPIASCYNHNPYHQHTIGARPPSVIAHTPPPAQPLTRCRRPRTPGHTPRPTVHRSQP